MEVKLIEKAMLGLALAFLLLMVSEFFWGQKIISWISLAALVIEAMIFIEFKNNHSNKKVIFAGIIFVDIYYFIVAHYYSIDFQFVLVFGFIFVFSSILFDNTKRGILQLLVTFSFMILMYLLRERIYFIKSTNIDDSIYILTLRIVSYFILFYFVHITRSYYIEKKNILKHEKSVSLKQEKVTALLESVLRKDNSFMPLFLNYYPDFTSKLLELNPQLTNTEIEVCALIKLGLNTTEIAEATNSSYKAIESIRFRIRKKINLPKRGNLTVFFNSL
ncbi:helix-turn-helix transcriptional regulator [Chryseobacterium sp. CT-SW4]|uniref:helix-turn-helix transcriptional regulator n=1 Tax=Chryseobacterium sp. SW-1 TaxID=3157343 RepID=UPI003B01B996